MKPTRVQEPVVRVAIVDDDETVLLLAEEVLTSEGMAVTTFDDPLAAFEAFQRERPDVLALDVMMPGLSGYAFCEQLRALPGGEDIPVLMMTALDDLASINMAYESGATDFAIKPVNWVVESRRLRYMLRASSTARALRLREQEALLSSRQWENTFNAIPDIVTVLDPDLRVLRANTATTQVLSEPMERILGQPCHRLLCSADTPCAECPVTRARQSGQPEYVELEYRAAGGFWLVGVSPVFDDQGRPVSFVHVAKNINQQRRAASELRRSQEVERLVGQISTEMLSLPPGQMQGAFDKGLERIGAACAADRALLCLITQDGTMLRSQSEWSDEGVASRHHQRQNIMTDMMPWWMSRLRAGKSINLAELSELPPEAVAERTFLTAHGVKSVLAVPMLLRSTPVGFLAVEAVRQARRWPRGDQTLLRLAAQVFTSAVSRRQAEEDLDRAHRRLLDVSRQAGMAEIATGVLHNVGNVLNSLNVSASIVLDRVRGSRAATLGRVVNLLRDHAGDLGEFLMRDPRGRTIPDYLSQLALHLDGERADLLKELDGLLKHVDHIKGIVAMQQNYARPAGFLEPLPADQVVEDALRIHLTAFARHQINITRQFENVPELLADKHKVLQILINLFSNAKHALDAAPLSSRRLVVGIRETPPGRVCIRVQDNGAGIAPENLARVFSHGFTTRKNGHGFGLHSSALAAREMGGSLSVASDGPGTGATFTLELPAHKPGAPATEAARRPLTPAREG